VGEEARKIGFLFIGAGFMLLALGVFVAVRFLYLVGLL
jgi:hypothetical protein